MMKSMEKADGGGCNVIKIESVLSLLIIKSERGGVESHTKVRIRNGLKECER